MYGFEKIAKVYNLFEDDISKQIFWDRLKYSISGESRYLIDAIMHQCLAKEEYQVPSNMKIIKLCRRIMEKKERARIAIFGASDKAGTVAELLREYGLFESNVVECFYVDNDVKKQGGRLEEYNQRLCLPIYPPSVLKENVSTYVIIAVNTYSNMVRIKRQLLDMGIPEDKIIRNLPASEFSLGNIYFDEDIMKPVPGDVFVDVGAFDLYNTEQFIKWNPRYEQVYAFEADPVSYYKYRNKQMSDNVELYHYGVWSEKAQVSFYSGPDGDYVGSRIDEKGKETVDTIALDGFLYGKKVTIIKMDIEGAELEALKGAKNIITSQKPCLALSVYHKPEDIIELPLYAYDLNPDYKFYLRHHTYGLFDTVLYAVDKCR